MSQGNLRTPAVKVRDLQEKLHRSAKANKSRRFHQLYDKVYTPWFLALVCCPRKPPSQICKYQKLGQHTKPRTDL